MTTSKMDGFRGSNEAILLFGEPPAVAVARVGIASVGIPLHRADVEVVVAAAQSGVGVLEHSVKLAPPTSRTERGKLSWVIAVALSPRCALESRVPAEFRLAMSGSLLLR